MTRRADAERIYQARRAAIRSRLIGSGKDRNDYGEFVLVFDCPLAFRSRPKAIAAKDPMIPRRTKDTRLVVRVLRTWAPIGF